MVFDVGLSGFCWEDESVVLEMKGDGIEAGNDDADGEGFVSENALSFLRMLEQFIQSGENGL